MGGFRTARFFLNGDVASMDARIGHSDDGDETRACADCAAEFTIAAGEQRFFLPRGMSLPRRCRPCREYRRQERAEGVR
jgi:hypothetical protein